MANAFFITASDPETGQTNITVFVPGVGTESCDSTHPNFPQISEAAQKAIAGETVEADVLDLFDVSVAVSKVFDELSERVLVRNGRVYFDGDEVHNALTRQIVRFLETEQSDWQPLVNFFEKVQTNPLEHSREQLYAWLERHEFAIADNGDFIAYKGVRRSSQDDVDYESIHSGPGIVNGVEVNGHLANDPGNTVEIARSYVNHDPAQGCSTGLHVGTYEYAKQYGDVLLKVAVNPRDVVSVPTDCSAQKVRTCRYYVLDVTDTKIESPLYEGDDDWYDDFEEAFGDDCEGCCR